MSDVISKKIIYTLIIINKYSLLQYLLQQDQLFKRNLLFFFLMLIV